MNKSEGEKPAPDTEDEVKVGDKPTKSRLRRALRRSTQKFDRGEEVQK